MRSKIRSVAAVIAVLAIVAGTVIRASAQTQINTSGSSSVAAPADDQATHEMHEAEAVSKRHEADLKKIPHVRSVDAEPNLQKEIAIRVQVDDPKNVDEVTYKLPSQLEGFPVDVDAAFDAQSGVSSADVDLGEGLFVENGFESSAKPTRTTDAKGEGSE
jgi:hypothetical protein